ncbi:MAG: hypothetical protein KDE55_06310 [Novosphingobium sp.]|nr:hypothetical protein [Novosphingobium sp.]
MTENKQPETLSEDDLDQVTGAGPILTAYTVAKAAASDPVGFASNLAGSTKEGMKDFAGKMGGIIGEGISKSVGSDINDIADNLNNDGDPSTSSSTRTE